MFTQCICTSVLHIRVPMEGFMRLKLAQCPIALIKAKLGPSRSKHIQKRNKKWSTENFKINKQRLDLYIIWSVDPQLLNKVLVSSKVWFIDRLRQVICMAAQLANCNSERLKAWNKNNPKYKNTNNPPKQNAVKLRENFKHVHIPQTRRTYETQWPNAQETGQRTSRPLEGLQMIMHLSYS